MTGPSTRPAVTVPEVVHLGTGAPRDMYALGGKGEALDRLVRAGFAVPPTAVVTGAAYRAIAADPRVVALLRRIESAQVVPAEEVDRVFLHVDVPASLASAIACAAVAVGGGGPVAVRSSATVEDLAEASSAGQYRSSLNVCGAEEVMRAVRLTWASLWHPAPCAYRRAWGISNRDIAMAIVVMRMVDAQWAGVVFTVDPVDPTRLRVEAVPELAESLVSGARTPRVWLAPRDTMPTTVDGHPSAVMRAAAELALRVERTMTVPQDVEWAWDGADMWLVQARPITTTTAGKGDGCDTPTDGSELTTAGIGEMLPGVLPPLVWDVNSVLVEEALRTVLGQLHAYGGDRTGPHAFIRRVRGRAALDLDLLKSVATTLPGGSGDELEREYFGVQTPAAAEGVPPSRWRLLRHHARAAAARRQATVESEVVVAAIDEVVTDRPDVSTWEDRSLLAYQHRLIDLGARTMAVELAVAAAAAGLYGQLVDMLAVHLGSHDGAEAAQRVTAGTALPQPPDPAASRSVFAGPSWAETGAARGSERRVTPAETAGMAARTLERRLRSSRRWRRIRMLTGQIIDVRIHILRRLIDDVARGLSRRERVKAAVLRLGGEVRRVHLELGRRLTRRRLLADAADIDLLRRHEIDAALHGIVPAATELARRRRWLRRVATEPPLTERFVGTPTLPPSAVPAGDHLRGWAASPGCYTGRARVVGDPVTDRFDTDEVLVAVATDAGWSPLFMRAGAIVVERGGPLSHAAIVARELGVPAVLNLAGATAGLDGRTVTVNGSTGDVVVHPANGGLDGEP